MGKQTESESDSGDDPPTRTRFSVRVTEREVFYEVTNLGKPKGRGSSVSKTVGFCPGCRERCHLTVHHIIPRCVLRGALLVLAKLRKVPKSKGVQAIFGDMRPPLIRLCRPCHDQVEKLMPIWPRVADEHEYYGALEIVIGPDYERFVYMGAIFARPSQICRDAERARSRYYEDPEEIFSYQPLLSYLRSCFANKQVRRAA